jgi:hypothetical protein
MTKDAVGAEPEIGPIGNGDSTPGGVSDEHRLGMLMDYTKFHIGLYAVAITTLIALSQIESQSQIVAEYFRVPILVSLVLVLLAGFCGGLIAGNLPEQKSFDGFWNGTTGIWHCKTMFRTCYVARAEHIFFWLAVLNAVLAVLFGKSYLLAGAG